MKFFICQYCGEIPEHEVEIDYREYNETGSSFDVHNCGGYVDEVDEFIYLDHKVQEMIGYFHEPRYSYIEGVDPF